MTTLINAARCAAGPLCEHSRNDQLKALGNGVVPPQARAALLAYVADEWGAA